MRKTRTDSRALKNCPHRETVSTLNYGLERVVCQACGHVSFQPLSDSVSKAVTPGADATAQASEAENTSV